MRSITNTINPYLSFIFIGLVHCATAQAGGVNFRNEDLIPSGKGHGEAPQHIPLAVNNGKKFLLDDSELNGSSRQGLAISNRSSNYLNGISYHGGAIMTGTPHVYFIWYGKWTGNSALSILPNLAQQIGGTPRYNINTTYYNSSGSRISNSVTYSGSTNVAYPYGTALSDSQIKSVVSNVISSAALPKDPNGIYFVLTSKDVNATSGFCTNYCGWHSHTSIAGTDIKYAFVGDSSQQCPISCEPQTVSPNGNPGADGMASIIVHELEETTTDPDLNAWYDSLGQENSDKCGWTFGATTTLANGSKYNMSLGSFKYLIQQNWVNASGGFCAQRF